MVGRAQEILMPSGVRIISITGGVLMKYPCGTSRFIRDSWYEDQDFGPGNVTITLSRIPPAIKEPAIIYSVEAKKHYTNNLHTVLDARVLNKNYYVHVDLGKPDFQLPPYEYEL